MAGTKACGRPRKADPTKARDRLIRLGFRGGGVAEVVDQELGIEGAGGAGLHDFVEGLFGASGEEFLAEEFAGRGVPARTEALVHGVLDLAGDHVGQDKALKVDGIGAVHGVMGPDGNAV